MKYSFRFFLFVLLLSSTDAIGQANLRWKLVQLGGTLGQNNYGNGFEQRQVTIERTIREAYAENYSLKVMSTSVAYNQETITLLFEKEDTSARDQAIKDYVQQAITQINATTNENIEKAKNEIEQKVLVWLKDIPKDVLTQEFAKNFKDLLLREVDDKIRKAIESSKETIEKTAPKK